MTRGKPDDLFSLGGQKRAGTDEQSACPSLDQRCKGCLDVSHAENIGDGQQMPEAFCRVLHVSSLALVSGLIGFASMAIMDALGTS